MIGVGNILAFQSMKLKSNQLTFDPQLTEIFQEGGSYKGMSDVLERKFKATIKKIRKENISFLPQFQYVIDHKF